MRGHYGLEEPASRCVTVHMGRPAGDIRFLNEE